MSQGVCVGRSALNEAESQRLPVGFTALATSIFNWYPYPFSEHLKSVSFNKKKSFHIWYSAWYVFWLFTDLHFVVWNETLKPFNFTTLLNSTQAKCITKHVKNSFVWILFRKNIYARLVFKYTCGSSSDVQNTTMKLKKGCFHATDLLC